MIIHRNRIVALGVAGALAIGFAVSAGPVRAAPVTTQTAALKQVDVSNVVDVQGRRWRRSAAPWVAGAALGIIGGVVANEMYRDRYYDNGYAYGPYGYDTAYSGQPYYGGYAPYGAYTPGSNCIDRPEAC